jgi:hypothetical protein
VFRRERIVPSCPAEPVLSGGVSYIVGGGNTSRAHPAFILNQMQRSRSSVIIFQTPQLRDIVHEVVAVTKSEELAQQLLEELKGLREDLRRIVLSGPWSRAHCQG